MWFNVSLCFAHAGQSNRLTGMAWFTFTSLLYHFVRPQKAMLSGMEEQVTSHDKAEAQPTWGGDFVNSKSPSSQWWVGAAGENNIKENLLPGPAWAQHRSAIRAEYRFSKREGYSYINLPNSNMFLDCRRKSKQVKIETSRGVLSISSDPKYRYLLGHPAYFIHS